MNIPTNMGGRSQRCPRWGAFFCVLALSASCDNQPECHDEIRTYTGWGPPWQVKVRVCDGPTSQATPSPQDMQRSVPPRAKPIEVPAKPAPKTLSTWKDQPIRAPDRPPNKACLRDETDSARGEFALVAYGGSEAPTLKCINREHAGGAHFRCGDPSEIRVVEIVVNLQAHTTFIDRPTVPADLRVLVREVQGEDGKWISVIADQDSGRIRRGDTVLAAARGRWLSPPADSKFFFSFGSERAR